mgnify:FL=1
MPDQPLKDIINTPAHALPAWNGEVAGLLEDLKPLCDAGYTVTLLAGTDRAAAGLARDLRDKGILVTTDAAAAPATVRRMIFCAWYKDFINIQVVL